MSAEAGIPAVREPLFSDDVLARLRRVVLHSRRLSTSGLSGEHRSRRKGPSPEFADFKAYTIGEDFRRIDWNAYARLDALYIRESEITTEFDVHILLDVSRSMDWSSDPDQPTKLRYALQLAGAFGYLALWHFDRLSITPIGSNAQRRFGPAQGRSNVRSMLAWLEHIRPRQEADLVDAMSRLVFERRRPGVLLAISDFLSDDLDRLEPAMRTAVSRGWDIALVQVEDPAEVDPALLEALSGTTQVVDLENRNRMPVRGDASALASYREKRGEWRDDLGRLGAGIRTLHIPLSTTQPVDQSLIQLLRSVGLVS
ncbi:MAG TPA: DUF58 domain-containing protein [Thermomicrobiales bacterium]|nr:DUF58 domain-containing protein [Thermomicrobiales bacterium]